MGRKKLAADTYSVVLIIHHVNKDTSADLIREWFAESNQTLAPASMDLLMDSKDLADGDREIRLQGRGRGDFANRTWLIRSTGPAGFQLVGDAAANARKEDMRGKAISQAIADRRRPMNAAEISEHCRLDIQTTRNLLKMLKEGLLTLAAKEGKTKFYSLPENSDLIHSPIDPEFLSE